MDITARDGEYHGCPLLEFSLTSLQCQSISSTAPTTISTFSIGTSYAYRSTTTQGITAALVALIALVQTHLLLPDLHMKRLMTGVIGGMTLLALAITLKPHDGSSWPMVWSPPELLEMASDDRHPIAIIASEARQRYEKRTLDQSTTLTEATAEYKRRYKRSPPPGFNTWFNMTQANDVILTDEFDLAMANLEPFWSLSPKEIRRRAAMALEGNNIITTTIRDHHFDILPRREMADRDHDMTKRFEQFARYLPDMDIPVNVLDEPRVLVPHDRLETMYEECSSSAETLEDAELNGVQYEDIARRRTWELAILPCSPKSRARTESSHAALLYNQQRSELSFLQDILASKNICNYPAYGEEHGMFIMPESMSVTNHLVPMWSTSKPSSFGDIIYPSYTYAAHTRADGDPDIVDGPWDEKKNQLFWAGSTTGGYGAAGVWQQMHRHRFVQLVNNKNAPIDLLKPVVQGTKAIWKPQQSNMKAISDLFQVTMTRLVQCDGDGCDEMRKAFPHLGELTDINEFRKYRYVYDVDGNGWSGRFHRLLLSKSTVFKQTLLQESHDDTLVAWVHYVPISMDMHELPETMRYLSTTEEGQELSRYIALEGRLWAERTLRVIDMDLYHFRILLEYARLIDDDRDGRCPIMN